MSIATGLHRVAWVDGVPAETVSAWELGLLLGHGAFETMRSSDTRGVRAVDLHLARLQSSLAALRLERIDVDQLRHEILAARCAIAGDALVRAIVARSSTGLVRIVSAESYAFTASAPVAVATVETRRLTPFAKLTSYGDSWQALAEASGRGASEALFVDCGYVVEGATSNVFMTDGDSLVTAPADGSLLDGVTRQLVIEAAQALGVDIVFERPSVEELIRCGAFLTSTKRGVAAVGSLDGAPLPVSRLVEALRARYEAGLASESADVTLSSRGRSPTEPT